MFYMSILSHLWHVISHVVSDRQSFPRLLNVQFLGHFVVWTDNDLLPLDIKIVSRCFTEAEILPFNGIKPWVLPGLPEQTMLLKGGLTRESERGKYNYRIIDSKRSIQHVTLTLTTQIHMKYQGLGFFVVSHVTGSGKYVIFVPVVTLLFLSSRRLLPHQGEG